jgi:hypothetical protein
MPTVYLGHEIIRCSRDLIRIQTATGNEDVAKGETKSIGLGYVAETLDWYCVTGTNENKEDQTAPNENPFNRILITRHAEGRRADVFFFYDV